MKLKPDRIVYGLYSERDSGRLFHLGEIEVTFDSHDTAWVLPSHKLVMTEEILDLIEKELEPLGIKWMRGWKSGHMHGRVIGDYKYGNKNRKS